MNYVSSIHVIFYEYTLQLQLYYNSKIKILYNELIYICIYIFKNRNRKSTNI